MRIAIIASHAWPLPSPARTGDSAIILDLTRTLAELGHDVTLFAPKGTKAPDGVTLAEMPLCSHGGADPSTIEAEAATLREHEALLLDVDIVHDCSVGKSFAEWRLSRELPAISTHWGGALFHPKPARNVVAQSHAQRERLLQGVDDYMQPGGQAADCRTVWNGIDTEAYAPTGKPKADHFLMFGRWHPVRGIVQAIELAKATGINLLIAGEDPERDHPYQANYAREMVALARGCSNISVEFLPGGDAHHTRKVELYSEARALLFLPQFQEPFGLPQVEAMACGTFVIANGAGSTREVNGGTFDMAADQSWLTKEQGWSLLGQQCRERAAFLFSRQAMTARYLELYEEVVAGRGWG